MEKDIIKHFKTFNSFFKEKGRNSSLCLSYFSEEDVKEHNKF